MADQKRTYRMKARAEQQDQTRLRITESAVALHGSLGPARTSMSAVAEHAGVPRSTLYRHFPDEAALFAACSAHWASQHQPPDPSAWAAIENPRERARRALDELYAFYEGGEPMLVNLYRDMELVEAVRERFAPFQLYLDACRDVLVAGRGLRGRAGRRARAAAGHAVAFATWRSLAGQGLTRAEAVDLMSALCAVN